MSTRMNINAQGFNNMVRALSKKTGASYKDVVRGVASSVLTRSAQLTKGSSAKKITEDVNRMLRKPYKTSDGDLVAVAKDGQVWYNGSGWQKDRWIKVNGDGKLKNVGKTVLRTGNQAGRTATLSSKLRSRINKAVKEARQTKSHQLKYKKARIHAGKKSFLEILKKLRIPIANTRGLGKAMKAITDPELGKAVNGFQSQSSRTDYEITISSKAQSALNPHSEGIFAFQRSLNGNIKAFEKAAEKDLETYAKQFALKNGFSVR